MKGQPFFYFSYGAAAVEVALDTLTGETRVLRADLVQDCGTSLNPAIDLGQIEGAFAQGLGWVTMEELWWDPKGRLCTVGPSTYKIPGSRDMPAIFNVKILEDAPARAETIFRSKGIGEPPLMLALAAWTALRDAIGSLRGHTIPVMLELPATPERVLLAVERIKIAQPSSPDSWEPGPERDEAAQLVRV
jgi:xanthine dehydrogenase large subunit